MTKRVPEIRFEDFTDDWEQRKWSETVDISTEMVNPKTGEYDSLPHIGPGNIESFTGRILDNVKNVKEDNLISGKFHFYPGDVIYGKINPQLGKYAMVDFEGLASADSYVLNTKNGVSQTFLFTILQGSSFYKYSVSVSMRTGMPKINRDELNQYSYSAPSVVEQEEIGIFFKQLDNTIALHQRKLEQLQSMKDGFLQKLFPKDGEEEPEIRFPGFTDDWEQRKLREVGNVVTGSTPSTLDKTNYNGSYLFVSPADIQGNRYVDKTITTLSEKGFRKGRILKEGAILFVSIGSTIGKVAQIRQEAVTNQQINAVVPHEDYDDNFIFSSLVKESEKIRLLSATQAVPIINKTTFSNIDIHIPGNIKEQIQIGAFFNKMDDTIALHQRELELLKQTKKAFLQKMFV